MVKLAREFKFGTGWRAKKYLKQGKIPFTLKKSNVIFINKKIIRFDMFLVYVFCVKVFGCQTKAQHLLEHNIFFMYFLIFLKSKVVLKTSNAQVFLEKKKFLG